MIGLSPEEQEIMCAGLRQRAAVEGALLAIRQILADATPEELEEAAV
jgi:hypothetical protein